MADNKWITVDGIVEIKKPGKEGITGNYHPLLMFLRGGRL